MDLNTGTTPIQGTDTGNTSLPPIPSQSTGLPNSIVPPTTVVTEQTSVTNAPVSPTNNASEPSFLNPLETLKQLTNKPEGNKTTGPKLPPIPTDSKLPGVVGGVPEAGGIQPAVVATPESPITTTPSQVATVQPTINNDTPPQPMQNANTSLPGSTLASPGTMSVGLIRAPYDLKEMLDLIVQKEASDLHLVVGYTPSMRLDGSLIDIGDKILTPEMAKDLVYSILPDDKKEQLEVNREVDLAYQHGDLGRFRINAYWQRGYISAAFRLIPTRIRTLSELNLPDIFQKFPDMEQGLVLVTGPTGHGKSTTLAAVIQEINMRHPKHILTIEDPIEYVFPQQKALVSQRELGDDTHSWKGALRSALREDPDVVLVGEMRDLETISAAITVAETGHLVFATLHTNNAAQTIQRIVNAYPDMQQEEIRTELADVLEAVVAQRLIPVKGGGRRAVAEIMLMTPAIRNLIRENKIHQIDNVIRTSLDLGMVTLERSLVGLYKDQLISQEDALRYALDPTEMARLLEELV